MEESSLGDAAPDPATAEKEVGQAIILMTL